MKVERFDDGVTRCRWGPMPPDYTRYHDEEWGRPVTDDSGLFEKVCLEGFQAGLSWLTILRKRDAFRSAFLDFDFEKLVTFGDADVERLVKDAGIIRHRGKIEATLNNAHRAVELAEAFGGLAPFFWEFASSEPRSAADVPATTPASEALSAELRARGWRFVGPTTMYALMQAMGLVNDHLPGCAFRDACEQERQAFLSPSRRE